MSQTSRRHPAVRWIAAWMVLTCMVVIGCRREESTSQTPSTVDTLVPSTLSTADRATAEAVVPVAPIIPDSVLREAGGCPAGCCLYGDWVANAPVPVFATERDASDTILTIQPGDRGTALTGNLYTTEVARVVVTREIHEDPSFTSSRLFVPGDTLYILRYLAEGQYRAWMDGEVYHPIDFWVDSADWTPDHRASGYMVGELVTDWWVNVRTSAGVEGWVRDARGALQGVVRCGP